MSGRVTVGDYITRWEQEIIPERNLAASSLTQYASHCRALQRLFGAVPIQELTTLIIADKLNQLAPMKSNDLRGRLADILREAQADGLISDNPAVVVRRRIINKKRKRLSLDAFYAIREQSPQWLKNAMDLALLTLQRESDILTLRYDELKDGALYVVQEKTKKHDTGYLKITATPQLIELVNRCRDHTVSPFLIHKPKSNPAMINGFHWSQVSTKVLQTTFKDARNKTELYKGWANGSAPTFHEIRALGIKLYKDQGADPQQLAGHASSQMTANYDLGHEDIRWIEAKAGLEITL
jgi:integrase